MRSVAQIIGKAPAGPSAGRFDLVAPIGAGGFAGRAKSGGHAVTAAIPHLDTVEPLKVCIDLLRAQSLPPYIIIVDTGSPPDQCAALADLRADDLEVHFIAGQGYSHTSEPVALALDVAQSRCRSELVFHTHTDCFLRRRDLLEDWAARCGPRTPAIGYRMSPRDWVTNEWRWMLGHAALMLHMPTVHALGATWSMQRTHHAFGYGWEPGGWPDTETGFNHALRAAGVVPVFLGEERNNERQVDDNIDHVRSFPGSKLYARRYHAKASTWMAAALQDARCRLNSWRLQ